MGKLQRFAIYGLWGERNYALELREEKLIVVGENGSGKTTVMRILFNCLACQWEKLKNEWFKRIEITIDNESKTIEYDQIGDPQSYEIPEKWLEDLPIFIKRRFSFESGKKYYPYEFLRVIEMMDLPEEYYSQMVNYLDELCKKIPDSIQEITEWLNDNLKYQIIYYPTYRRFEDKEKRRNVLRHSNRWGTYWSNNLEKSIIVSQSGMDDVETKIADTLLMIREAYSKTSAELNLNCFTGILKHDFNQSIDITEEEADPEYVETVFNSISGSNLSETDIRLIKDKLLKILEKNSVTQDYDKIVIYFYNMLVQRFKSLKEKEECLEQFFYSCNGFLNNKQFVYDPNSFRYSIMVETHTGNKKTMKIDQLSSGEKQIVAMFCYLCLDDSVDKLIVIDEPELSLSVDWQERILEDISQMPMCKSLIVATQSPFVYDNSLRKYARGIEEFLVLE